MYVALFYGQVNPNHDALEYEALGLRMYELASKMPGFVDFKQANLPDSCELAIAYFETEEDMQAWYDHPEHRKAQIAGRESILDDYLIEVCEIKRSYTKSSSYFQDDTAKKNNTTFDI